MLDWIPLPEMPEPMGYGPRCPHCGSSDMVPVFLSSHERNMRGGDALACRDCLKTSTDPASTYFHLPPSPGSVPLHVHQHNQPLSVTRTNLIFP